MPSRSSAEVTGPDDALELRCPQPWGLCPAGKLLAKLKLSGGQPSFVKPDNLIELECADCTKRLRKEGRMVRRVLHRYDFLGQLVETLEVTDLSRLPFPAATYYRIPAGLG